MSQPVTIKEENRGYRDSFNSSALLGGSQVFTYVLGILRTKALAYLLGPGGIGLVGLYTSILGTVSMFSGFGIAESSIREIASANGTRDHEKLSQTVKVVRKSCLVSGFFGLILCAVLANPLSIQTFGNGEHSVAIAILGFTLLIGTIYSADIALLQGTGRVSELAKMNIYSSVAGLLPVILVYLWFREKGIVPALLLSSLLTLAISKYFTRSISLSDVRMTWREMIPETKILLSLGFAFMLSGLVGTGKDLIIRAMITRNYGIESMGIYQSAWMISGLFATFVLKAMGMDFYPRLTSMNHDHASMSKAVNQQIEIGVLLALPGVLATITFAPLVLTLLYSSKFQSGSAMLAVMSCGIFFKMISYPINTIQLAMGDARGFVSVAIILTLLELGVTIKLLMQFGLIGAAIAFPIFCFLHIFVMAWTGRKLIRYSTKRSTVILACIGTLLVLVGLLIAFQLEGLAAYGASFLLLFVTMVFCVRQLTNRLERDHYISKMILKLPFSKFLVSTDV